MAFTKREGFTIAIILVSVLLIVGLLSYIKLSSLSNSKTDKIIDSSLSSGNSGSTQPSDVNNGNSLTNNDKTTDNTPSTLKAPDIKLTNQVLLKEAAKENIVVTDSDVEKTIEKGLQTYNISTEVFQQNLASSGYTYDQYKEALKAQIAISNVISKNIDLKSVTVTEAEIDAYFEANKDQFQDFLDNPDAMALLRLKIKSILLRDKQNELVQNYVNELSQQ